MGRSGPYYGGVHGFDGDHAVSYTHLKTATDEQANETIGLIRETIASLYGQAVADQVRIQYGGSMNPKNVKGLMAQPQIDGGLIGGASLKAADFAQVVNYDK